MITDKELRQLLKTTGRILQHKREKEKWKGERFNVFSILKMESRENETHSAFLTELLNPKGSHGLGAVFLKIFLEIVERETEQKTWKLDLRTASVTTEKHIGFKDNKAKTGGRIDIYIRDGRGNIISVENKIYAADQPAQLERYCNHQQERNKVYYLTLKGIEPSLKSCGNLIAGEDYFLLSYKEHITEWLEGCIKEAAEHPVVRESLRQYLVLIRKLTYTMDRTSENELLDAMLHHYVEASFIQANFVKAGQKAAEQFRQEVFALLKEKFSQSYQVKEARPASEKWSSLHLRPQGQESAQLYFGIESFSGQGHFGGQLFIGIKNPHAKDKEFAGLKENKAVLGDWWINVFKYSHFEGFPANMSSAKTIQQLHRDSDFRRRFAEHIVTETEDYLDQYKVPLVRYLEGQKTVVTLEDK
ncbi:PDDEXK-like family protein [Nafulsella turpanensis]|uniref:PDDEXK-like family protein n=1 Tax=Nafulsella turpanensis TaxID=1265690 RepID=UPI00034D9C99|nr:PD-(D/E)XK nuclease family protein [Nafulsella turpanensis]